MKSWKQTKLTELLGIEYPIVQGPFGGGLSSVELTAMVSNEGGLGSYGGQPFSAAELVETAHAIRSQTAKPFNINLWVEDRDPDLIEFDVSSFRRWKNQFQPYFEELKLPLPELPLDLGPRFEDQIEAIFDIRPSVLSFVYGIPSSDILEKCRKLGIHTIGAATNVEEAIALENAGVDAIVATGFEAGGHRVSFLRKPEESLMGIMSLIPQVADAVQVPVIAAGGIADARGIKASLILGASGVQMGTAFLATRQSNASKEHKELLFKSNGVDTTLTRVFSGRLARGLKNKLTDGLAGKNSILAPYPLQGKLMGKLKNPDLSEKINQAFRSSWAGQSVSLLKYKDATDLFSSLVREMDGFL